MTYVHIISSGEYYHDICKQFSRSTKTDTIFEVSFEVSDEYKSHHFQVVQF